MKFKKVNGVYVGVRFDGQVINIERTDYDKNTRWVSRYAGDHDGDNTEFFSTLREAQAAENSIEVQMLRVQHAPVGVKHVKRTKPSRY